MRVHTCQAATLPKLMETIRQTYGPDASLLSVRRVQPAPGEFSGMPFIVEGTVGFRPQNSVPTPARATPLRVPSQESLQAPKFVQPQPTGRPAWLQAAMQTMAPIEPTDRTPLAALSTVALVGPMGSGKTTAAAKIAARLARLTHKSAGLISTDTERPGGSALLMAYASELSMHGTEAPSASELRDRIARWNCRGPLVIDTHGCGPRDCWAIERLGETLDAAGVGETRYLVLSATEHPAIARECLKAYATIGIQGVVLTRVDQAAGIGHCLEEIRKRNVAVKYITTGERVPEDLMEPTPENLRALEMSRPLSQPNAQPA